MFGADNNLSSQADNYNNNFLLVDEGPSYGINWRKRLALILVKQIQTFPWVLHYNADHSYLFVNGKEISKFKAENKNVNFPTQFCLRSISNGFSASDSRGVSLNGIVYDVSVDYYFIVKANILNIHKYLMAKNNIK